MVVFQLHFQAWNRKFGPPPLSDRNLYDFGLNLRDSYLGRSETTPSRVCPFGAVLLLVSIIRKLG